MRTTGKFDSKGSEVFEGDKVIRAWGCFDWNGNMRTIFKIHTITVKPAHLMANRGMHDDGGGIIFCLGKVYNFWKGESVTKLTDDDIDAVGMPEETEFFLDYKGKAIEYTDQHFMKLSDEDWKEEMLRRQDMEHELLFGNPITITNAYQRLEYPFFPKAKHCKKGHERDYKYHK